MLRTLTPRNNYEHITPEHLHVLIISKPFDPECQEVFLRVLIYLQSWGVIVYSNEYSVNSAQEEGMIQKYKN